MQNLIQKFGEAILPLVGFYYWNWDWYFILIFYILDVFAKEIIINLQANKIYQTQGGTETYLIWKKSAVISLFIGMATLILVHLIQLTSSINFSISKEILNFFYHKEMGLPQGIILIPFIFLNVWLQYKLNFLKLNMQLKMKTSLMWQRHINYRLFILVWVVITLGLALFLNLKDSVFLWGSILLPIVYQKFFNKEV